MTETNIKYWKDFLNDRAAELGLEKKVVTVKPRESFIEPVQWAFQQDNGDVIMLGWNVDEAEASLRGMAGG